MGTHDKYYDEIVQWDWDKIVEEAQNNLVEDEEYDGLYGFAYLGSVLNLFPSGKFYTAWTTNQTEEDVEQDTLFAEALDEVANEHGGFIGTPDWCGDYCDIYFILNLGV